MEENELRVEMKGISKPASNEAATMQNHAEQTQETCGNASADTTLDTKRLTVAEPLDLSQFEGHTPGDWHWSSNWDCPGTLKGAMIRYHSEPGINPRIADVSAVAPGSQRICDANARLIAAAPALLEECRRLRARVERLETGLESIVSRVSPHGEAGVMIVSYTVLEGAKALLKGGSNA